MELVKKSKDYQVFKKRSGRYAVQAQKKWVKADEKVAILVKEGLLKEAPKAKKEEAEATEE